MATETRSKAIAAMEYTRQANRLSYVTRQEKKEASPRNAAVEARFVTAHDPVVVTASGGRLPVIPLEEAEKLNRLKREVEGFDEADEDDEAGLPPSSAGLDVKKHRRHGHRLDEASPDADADGPDDGEGVWRAASAPLRDAIPPARTTPLFPPIPLYGPPGTLLKLQGLLFRFSSFFLSLGFLAIIVLGSIFTSLPTLAREGLVRMVGIDPDKQRPFYEEELRRKKARKEANRAWTAQHRRSGSRGRAGDGADEASDARVDAEFEPTEGGPDPVVCDIGYYARRVGLDAEEYEVQTEDGFIISLWHIYNPKEYRPAPAQQRRYRSPEVFRQDDPSKAADPQQRTTHERTHGRKPKYPVLLMHGLLQSSGAYCANDDDSLAFYLCKR